MKRNYEGTPDDNDFHMVLTSPIMSMVQPYWYDHQRQKWFSSYNSEEGLDSVYCWFEESAQIDWTEPRPMLFESKPTESGFYKCGVEGFSHQEAYYNADKDTWSCFGHIIENVNCYWYDKWWNGIKLADGRTMKMSTLKRQIGNYYYDNHYTSNGIKILCKCHID
jgi:hypothetical protein